MWCSFEPAFKVNLLDSIRFQGYQRRKKKKDLYVCLFNVLGTK